MILWIPLVTYCIEDLLVQNKPCINGQTSQMKIIYNSIYYVCLPSNRRRIKSGSK